MSKLPPLTAAVADLNAAEAARLLAADPLCVNELSWEALTPLHWACTGRASAKICEMLLGAGANADLQNSWGSTPLHYACYGNHVECVRVLRQGGASLAVVDRCGRTPKEDAERRGHGSAVELLSLPPPPDDLIGFDSSIEPTEGGVVVPPPGVGPASGTTWQREKWQDAAAKVKLMQMGVTAFQDSVSEPKQEAVAAPAASAASASASAAAAAAAAPAAPAVAVAALEPAAAAATPRPAVRQSPSLPWPRCDCAGGVVL